MKKVIDGDNMRLLETFDESKVNEVAAKYEALYDEVLIDDDNDITVYNNN